jgi:acetate kinase
MHVLVLNTGSSSVKYELLDLDGGQRRRGIIEEVADADAAVRGVVDELGDAAVDLVGHRVVHGGEVFTEPTVLDDAVIDQLRGVVPLAPLHLPGNLAGIAAARRHWPDVAHVAVFDTAFHRTLPAPAYRYAVPASWYEDHGVRRYGFHGTSNAYVSRRAAELLARSIDELDLIVAHLGNGASITAIRHGASIDTSMGLSPLEGLVMGTRSGDIDPSVVTHIAAATNRPPEQVVDDLNRASGLLGLCGDSDMRTVTERAARGDVAAALAIDVFVHRIRRYVGAFLAVLGRCDALVFTGGIGEHSSMIRARICAGLDGLGIAIDPVPNDHGAAFISPPDAATAVLVIATDEELEIAHQAAAVAAAADPQRGDRR